MHGEPATSTISLWRSPLGRRLVGLLLGSALLPLLAFALFAFWHVSAELRRQNEIALHDAAKTAGMGIAARLGQLAADFDLVAALCERGEDTARAELARLPQLRSRCRSLWLQTPAAVLPLANQPLPGLAELAVPTGQGGRLCVQVVGPDARLLASRRLHPLDTTSPVLAAEIERDWLFERDELRAHGAEVLIVDPSGSLLFHTLQQPADLRLLQANVERSPASGSVQWLVGGVEHLARYWRAFLRPQYGLDLLVVQTRPAAAALYAVHGFERWFLLTAALTLLGIALLGGVQLRRLLQPFGALMAATRRVAAGDYDGSVGIQSCDEFGALGTAFDGMTRQLREQLQSRQRIERDLAASRDAALAAARAKAEFLTNVSHELRTPLAEVLGATEILAGIGDSDPAARLEFTLIAHRGAQRLRELVEDVLSLDASAGFALQPVDLAASVEQALQQLPSACRSRVQLELPPELPPVQGVDHRLSDCWRRLLDNAAKFSPPGSPIVLRARWTADTVELEVEDQGVGISRLDYDRIFEPFQQAGRDQLTDKAAGTGLGLAIVRRTLERCGGSITVESELGNGAVFRVRLQAAAVLARMLRERPAANATPTAAAGVALQKKC